MKWFINNWYWFGLGPATISMILLALFWGETNTVQHIMILNFVVILLHQVEEYGWPGGEPLITNVIQHPNDKGMPDRYPLNQFNACFANVVIAYIVYTLPIFFPNVAFLCIAPVLFGMGPQVMVHCIVTNIKMKTWYNPGMAAVVCGHVPLGIWYIVYGIQNGLFAGMDWVYGIIYMVLAAGIILGLITYKLLPDVNTKWPFTQEEVSRFKIKEKLEKAGFRIG